MNATVHTGSLILLFATAAPVLAQEAPQSLPAVRVDAVHHVFDCQDRGLPPQRAVGEWTGQHNFSQVYATRQRLMGEVARACNRPGIGEVNLVLERRQGPGPGGRRWVAQLEPRHR